MSGEDEFAARAAAIARNNIEEQLIQANRAYEDALRSGDEYGASTALEQYADAQQRYNLITGSGEQQQNNGQLSREQMNYLSRRAAGGDELTPQRMRDYALAHTRAVNAGLEVDSPQYFAAISRYADTMGDGRQPPLDEREAAKISGISEQEYAAHAARLRALKAAGHYNE